MPWFAYQSVVLRHPSPAIQGATRRLIPMIVVSVTGPGRTMPIRFRLDCGADDTILPQSYAAALGIDLTNAPMAVAETVGGAIIRYPCATVTFRLSDGIEWCQWEAIVGFVPGSRQTGLAGLAGFLDYFDVGLLGGREITLTPTANLPGQSGRH